MTETIKCLFSCNKCGLKDISVQVPVRNPNQDIVDWMNKVVAVKLSDAHFQRSPHCRITSLSEVKIPINKKEDSYIGESIKEGVQ